MYRTRKASAEPRGPAMEIEVITLCKVPVKVMCFGGVTPSRIVKFPDLKPQELVLIVPGNPGLVEFYPEFGARINAKTQLPVWIISHGGHEDLPSPPLSKRPDLYNLQGQLKQKQELLDSYLKGVTLRCIGHSIGCKMLLDLLGSGERYSKPIQSCYFLFPTVERMAESTNGKWFIFLSQYLRSVIMLLLIILNILPSCVKRRGIELYLMATRNPLSSTNAMMKLLEPRLVRKVVYLAEDEMKNVVELDDEVIRRFHDRLHFYYSPLDGWTPKTYYEEFMVNYPEVRTEIDQKGVVHSFVLKHSVVMGDVVSGWLTEENRRVVG